MSVPGSVYSRSRHSRRADRRRGGGGSDSGVVWCGVVVVAAVVVMVEEKEVKGGFRLEFGLFSVRKGLGWQSLRTY